MAEPYFIYKNINSKDMGILVNEPPPIIKIPRNINKVNIPGRNGFLTEDFTTYGEDIKPCECTLLDIAMVDQVLVWLDGLGEVIFSNQPDRKYQACIINKIPFNRIMRQWHKFIVIFDCQPLARMLDNTVQTLTIPGNIINTGTCIAKPIIKVYGSGAIDLSVNGKVIHLTGIVDYITIDSQMIDAYRDTALMNSNMLGDFPELIVGANAISWTGSVTSVEITPNWGYL